MRAFTYERVQDVPAALKAHAQAVSSAYVAGGTTLIDLIKLDVMRPAHVVDVNHVGLTEIETLPDGAMRVEAMVRNSDLAWHRDVRARYPVLAEALLCGASSQLRNMATTGGNLLQRTRCPYFRDAISPCNKREPGSGCAALAGYNRSHAVLGGSEACIATHPSDMCVALAALDAQVVLRGAAGERTMPIGDFHLLPGNTPEREHAMQPGDLVTAVILPAPSAGTRSWYVKLRDRESYEFALASAAVVLRLEGGKVREVRIALGGVATKPWRAREAEEALRGAEPTAENFQAAARAAVKHAAPRTHNAFKVDLVQRVIVRALSLVSRHQPEVRKV